MAITTVVSPKLMNVQCTKCKAGLEFYKEDIKSNYYKTRSDSEYEDYSYIECPHCNTQIHENKFKSGTYKEVV